MPHVADLTARHPSVAPGTYGWIPEGSIPLVEAMMVEIYGVLAATGLRLAIHDAKENVCA